MQKIKKRDLGAELISGIQDLKNGLGKRYIINSPKDIIKIRQKLELTQNDFSALLGVSVRTLQDWEQGRRFPRGPALSLLKIAQNNPRAFIQQ